MRELIHNLIDKADDDCLEILLANTLMSLKSWEDDPDLSIPDTPQWPKLRKRIRVFQPSGAIANIDHYFEDFCNTACGEQEYQQLEEAVLFKCSENDDTLANVIANALVERLNIADDQGFEDDVATIRDAIWGEHQGFLEDKIRSEISQWRAKVHQAIRDGAFWTDTN